MSRPRPMSRSNTMTEEAQIMTQVWHGLVDTLRQLPPMTPGTRILTDDEKPTTRSTNTIQTEKQSLDEALDQIKVLIDMRRNEEQSQDAYAAAHPPAHALPIPTVQVSTPSSSGGNAANLKRKRRTSLSYSASPAPTPIPHSADSGLTSIPSPLPGARSATPGGNQLLGKPRKDMPADQLPLQKGRRAVYKQPPASKGDEENWILVTIENHIGNDMTKYRVLDADIDSESVMVYYDTTLRSLIPLPDPSVPTHLSTHPQNIPTFPRNTQVLGLYPDTTSFYRATVVSPPSRGGAKVNPERKDMYELTFVDDGDAVHDVHRYNVIKYPA